MKRFEQILLTIFGLAVVLKITAQPLSGMLLLLSTSLLSVVYFYLGFAFFNEVSFRKIFKKGTFSEIPKGKIFLAIGAGLSLSIVLTGILFRFQRWPGSGFMLLVGIVLNLCVLVWALISQSKSDENNPRRILIRVALFLSVALFLYLLPLRTQLEWEYSDHPEYIEAVLEFEANPNDREAYERMMIQEKKLHEARNSDEFPSE